MSQVVRLLHHPASQPCRSVHQLLLENEIPFEEEVVDLMSGINETREFKDRYNPTGQVPILCDGDFVVWESAAIGFYVNERFGLPGHWFGSDARQRAIVQQYLHWHSTMLRRGAGAFFYTIFAECIWGPRDYSKEIAKGRQMLDESLTLLERWLSRQDYVCGTELSFADLMAYHELVSHVAGAILTDADWRKFPSVKAWYDGLTERPHSQAVSGPIMQIGKIRLSGELIPMTRKTSLAKGTGISADLPI